MRALQVCACRMAEAVCRFSRGCAVVSMSALLQGSVTSVLSLGHYVLHSLRVLSGKCCSLLRLGSFMICKLNCFGGRSQALCSKQSCAEEFGELHSDPQHGGPGVGTECPSHCRKELGR